MTGESNRPADDDRAGGRNTLTRQASGDLATPSPTRREPASRPCIAGCGLAAAAGDVYCEGCRSAVPRGLDVRDTPAPDPLEPRACEHDWRRLRPVVRVIGEADRFDAPAETYNAECERCGAHAWLHWPIPRYERNP